jgi:hypothetical protein
MPRLLGAHRAGLDEQDAGDDLQAVADAVLHLLQQDVLLLHKLLQVALHGAPLGNVLDGEQDGGVAVLLIEHLAGVEQHGAPPEDREVLLNLESIHHGVLRGDVAEQRTKLRDVPLAVAQRIDGRPCTSWRSCETSDRRSGWR